MEFFRFDGPLDESLIDPVIVAAFDGWTDAGRAGTLAADTLRAQWQTERVGVFDSDQLYDYRDRRPILSIDAGVLGDPIWPALEVFHLSTQPRRGATVSQILLIAGGEPDFNWQRLCAKIVELAKLTGASRYVGLGAVPGPVPHTRLTRITSTSTDEVLLERYGRPHEHLTVPASCQVLVEAALGESGCTTLGFWARIPHYMAGEYPAGAEALLRLFADVVDAEIDLSDLAAHAAAHRNRLDMASSSSQEILAHIRELERSYDADLVGDGGFGPLPSGDELAAELERFLRRQSDG